jgi:predicted metal-dependent phosphoesterase TrpH
MIDLHCHSVFSDGTYTPEELVKLAEEAGLTALALTDHDTVDGLPRFLAAGASSPVETISGIELSAEYAPAPLHLLGLCIDPASAALQEVLEWVRAGRTERNVRILEKLNALGYDLTHDEIRKHSATDLIGRPHFAAALIEKGHFKHRQHIFRQLLGKGKAAYADRRRLTPEACVEHICAAGGVAVIAHPGQMRLSRRNLRRLVKKLKEHGLGGLEVYHPTHPPHQVSFLENVCEEFDLIATGGSDFHGALTPDRHLGTGFGDLQVSDDLLGKLKARAIDSIK